MNPSYKTEALAKEASKFVARELGAGWKAKIVKDGLANVFRPSLVFRNTLEVWPVDNAFRANLKGHPNWEEPGKTASKAVDNVLKFFQKTVPSLVAHIDEAFRAYDAILYRDQSPFRDALRVICGAEPPNFVRGDHSHNYTDEENMQLQDWCSMHARPRWATGLGIIEAAELLVSEAYANDNLKRNK